MSRTSRALLLVGCFTLAAVGRALASGNGAGAGGVKRESATDPAIRREVERLRCVIASSDRRRKEEAALAIRALGPAALPYLLEIYPASAESEAIYLTYVLRNFDDPVVVPLFIQKLAVESEELQKILLQSLEAFADSKSPGLFDAAASLATNGRKEVRRCAYSLLTALGDARAVPIYLSGLESGDTWICELSEEGLRDRIAKDGSGDLANTLLRRLPLASDEACGSIVRLLVPTHEPRAASAIADALGRKSPVARRAAVRALAALGEPSSAEPLEHVLEDEDSVVRREAIAALEKLKVFEAIPLIADRLRDPVDDVRIAARRSLVSLAGRDVGAKREAWIDWYSKNDRP